MKITRSNAPHYVWGEDCDGWRLVDREQLSVIFERMPPGAKEVRHRHARASQLFFILSGSLTIEIDGAHHRISRNESVEVTKGLPHQVLNESDAAVEFLVISHPSTRADRVQV